MSKTRGNSPASSSNISFIIMILLLHEVQKIEAKQITENPEITAGLAKLQYPDFVVRPSGGITINPVPAEIIKHGVTILSSPLQESLTPEKAQEARQLCDEAIAEILSEDSWLPRAQLWQDIRDRSLKIVLGRARNEETMGGYSVDEETVYLDYKSHLAKNAYKKALFNELMSHLIVKAHKRCHIISPISNKTMAIPFLKKDGTLDPQRKKQMQQAIETGSKYMSEIKALWQKRTTCSLSTEENHLLIQFLAAAKHYKPQTFCNDLSVFGGEKGIHYLIEKNVLQRDGDYLEPGPNYPIGQLTWHGKIQGNSICYHHTKNIHSAKGRIEALFNDFHQFQQAMQAKHGPYAEQDENHKLAEMATFIAQFPKPVLQMFFPDFFTYTTHYLSRCSLYPPAHRQTKQPQYEKTIDKPQATKDQPRQGKSPR
ncbi:hypothetical protein AYO45_00250 [Gammaproteobacteria bacterium SCGC AG-212-F23]|nr:hypothetical protein AYO45_00250 [Gammaproteobacteria bacterium SCGC AG-212-F23]